jgi:hypothetical protein
LRSSAKSFDPSILTVLPETGTSYFLHTPNAPVTLELPRPDAFNVPLDQQHVALVKAVAARALLPTMRDELEHARQAGVVCTNMKPAWRSTCDGCKTACFNASYVCVECARYVSFAYILGRA